MSFTNLDRGVGALVVVFTLVAWLRWRGALPAVDVSVTRVPSVATAAVAIPTDSLDAYVEMTSTNDPFRLSNRPADVRFDPRVEGGSAGVVAPVIAAPRPLLIVRGIVGGPPWQAIVDGLPGQSAGTVVAAGTSFDKFVVRTVSRDTVVVQGPDTTWKLTLNRPKP